MTFEETFFGPGNRLNWGAIQARSLPPDVQDRLGPFLDDLRSDPEVLILPRVRATGEVQWYVLCASPRAARIARDEVRGFLGPSYCDFDGRPSRLDPNDSVEAAVLERCGNNAFRLDISDRAVLDIARERLRLLIRLRHERPVRHARRLRAVGRVLRDFEYALLARDITAARDLIDELRSSGHLGATNVLFLEVRRLAVGGHGDAILALPELDALLAMPRPRRVTEALINAVYGSRLKEFEEGRRASDALDRFRSETLPRFGDLYRSRASLSGYEVDVSFVLAAAAPEPARPDAAEAILNSYPAGAAGREYLMSIAALGAPPVDRTETSPLAEARAAFGEADIDRAFNLAVGLPTSFERTAIMLRCARDMGILSAAMAALDSVEGLSGADRVRLRQNTVLEGIVDSLNQLSAARLSEPSAGALNLPTNWVMWLERLAAPEPWHSAVSVAEIASREWSVDDLVADPTAVHDAADLLLRDRSLWGQEALRDALPYFLGFCLRGGVDPRLKAVYESLFLIIAVDDQVSLPQIAAIVRIAEARFALGVSLTEYDEILDQLMAAFESADSFAIADVALDALDTLVGEVCPAPHKRADFLARVAAIFNRWYRRIDPSQWVLLRRLGEELDIPNAVGNQPIKQPAAATASIWTALDHKRVALYSLRHSALRRAASILLELCPSIRIDTFSDYVGGSSALRAAAATADIFVVATAAAKHAATLYIDANRPTSQVTLYARGQGSASLLEAVRDYLRK